MYMKKCKYCKKISYSASNFDKWLCPHCGKNISDENFVKAKMTGKGDLSVSKKEDS